MSKDKELLKAIKLMHGYAKFSVAVYAKALGEQDGNELPEFDKYPNLWGALRSAHPKAFVELQEYTIQTVLDKAWNGGMPEGKYIQLKALINEFAKPKNDG